MSVHETQSGWVVRWKFGGEQPSKTFRRDLGFTRDDAVAWDLRMKRQKVLGIDPLAAEQPFADTVTEWWAGHHLKLKTKESRDAKRNYADRLMAAFPVRTCDVTPAAINQYRIDLVRQGVGPATIQKLLSTLSSIFAYAQIAGLVDSDPVAPIERPSAPRQRLVRPFPAEAAETLRVYFLAARSLEEATFVSLLALTGAPPQDILALTRNDIYADGIYFRRSKTARERVTRILEPLRADLDEYLAAAPVEVGRLFPWPPSRYRNWARRHFKPMAAELGIEATRPYDLRHAFATLLLQEGRDTRYIAQQLGHNPGTSERHYQHLEHLGEERISADEAVWRARGRHERLEAANG